MFYFDIQDGLPGKDGRNGKDGVDGAEGAPGQPGKVGDRGDPGPQGGESQVAACMRRVMQLFVSKSGRAADGLHTRRSAWSQRS